MTDEPKIDLADAWRRMLAALVAVSPRLEVPYEAKSDLSPWTRFIGPAQARVTVAIKQHDATIESRVRAQVAEEIAQAIGDNDDMIYAREAADIARSFAAGPS